MGRKIPGKKHRGVKDPYVQSARRFDIIKNKINKAPCNPDDQPVPKSLIRLMSWKNKKPKGKQDNKRNLTKIQKNKDLNKHKRNPVNQLKKIPGESNKSFNVRINEAMKSLMVEKTFDDISYDLPDEEKESRNESKEYLQKKTKKKKNDGESTLTKAQKKVLKDKMKKEKLKTEKELDKKCEVKRDHIAFGEIVHEPPSLNIKPRKAQLADTVPRPARKDLLLNKLFESSQSKQHNMNLSLRPNIKIYPKNSTTQIDLKGKRKDLPAGVRRKIEETQREAIEAYKLIKLSKLKKKDS